MALKFITLICCIYSAIGFFLFGYDSGIISSIIANQKFIEYMGTPDVTTGTYTIDTSKTGAIVSVFAGGALIGALLSGYLADKISRKRTILVGGVIAFLGGAIQGGASNLEMMIAGRIILGLAVGILSMVCPIYMSEIAPPEHRGLLTGLAQQILGIGFIVANWVTYGCSFISSDNSWRVPLWLQVAPAGLLILMNFAIPYSPRWLIEKNREEEAQAVIIRLHGENAFSGAEFNEMRESIVWERDNSVRSVSVLFSTPAMRRRVLAAFGVQAFGQFTGINVVNYYGPTIYQSLGIIGNKALLVQGLYGVVGPITNLIFIIFLVDRAWIGRKRSLIFGAITLALILAIEAGLTAQYPTTFDAAGNVVAANLSVQRCQIAMFFCVSIVFSLSFGPVSWIYSSEVWPMSVRALGVAGATATNWAFNILFGQASPIAMSKLGWKYWILFIILNIVDAIVIFLFFPETRNKSLEEIAVLFGDEAPVDAPRATQVQTYAAGEGKLEKEHDIEHRESHGHVGY